MLLANAFTVLDGTVRVSMCFVGLNFRAQQYRCRYGYHRVLAAMEAGETQVSALVLQLGVSFQKAVAPEPAPFMPVPTSE